MRRRDLVVDEEAQRRREVLVEPGDGRAVQVAAPDLRGGGLGEERVQDSSGAAAEVEQPPSLERLVIRKAIDDRRPCYRAQLCS